MRTSTPLKTNKKKSPYCRFNATRHCPPAVAFGCCNLEHPSLGIHHWAESAAAAAAAATAAWSCAQTANIIVVTVNHEVLTMRELLRSSGRSFCESGTQSHARTVSREIPNQYVEPCWPGSCCQCVTTLPTCWHRGFLPQHASQEQKG